MSLNTQFLVKMPRNLKQKYRTSNPEKIRLQLKNWKDANRDKCNAIYAKYRASKLSATPPWLTLEHLLQIQEIYKECKRLSIETGIKHHVDHIIPLQGVTVCGLHVPWNLQILTAFENVSKHNSIPSEYDW